jgi:hypothetical protein
MSVWKRLSVRVWEWIHMAGFGVQWRDIVNTVTGENYYQPYCRNISYGMEIDLRVS